MCYCKGAALAALCLAAGAANAAIVILVGPGNFEGDQNVLYNENGLLDNGPLVQGLTNQTGAIVDFFDAGEDLVTPSGGQARVEAVDGGFSAMSIQMDEPGSSFSTIILNLHSSGDGTVMFDIVETGVGSTVAMFDLDGSGENFFRIYGDMGSTIDKLSLVTTVDQDDIRQVRIGGAVPEPSALLALGVGLALYVVRLRR
ncbi:MAG TPA: PEP-CTERM sorting domain-containing protein [Fimbriimonadales bacterium]|nr:PEP-CTERM sorting domain-containing protein [Fimbriimonadales bacterium]